MTEYWISATSTSGRSASITCVVVYKCVLAADGFGACFEPTVLNRIKRHCADLQRRCFSYCLLLVLVTSYSKSSIWVARQGHSVTSHLGDNMASVTWVTKVSTKWVDQIDQLTDIFEEVSIFVVWLGRFAPFAK